MLSARTRIAAAGSLHRLNAELCAQTSSGEAVEGGNAAEYEASFADPTKFLARLGLIDTLFRNANLIAGGSSAASGHARFALTRLALEAAEEKRTPKITGEGVESPGCLNAEMQLGRSLDDLGRPWRQNLGFRGWPAVLFDVDGQPCAYQKEHGNSGTIFVWRRAHMATQDKERIVPAGSFVRLQYANGSDDVRFAYRPGESGVIALRDHVPDSIELLRFSTLVLNRAVAHTALSDRIQDLQHYAGPTLTEMEQRISKMSRMTPDEVGAQACEYLDR